MKKILLNILFAIYTYCIINSIYFAIAMCYPEKLNWGFCLENFIYLFCQWDIIRDFRAIIENPYLLLLLLPVLIYEIAILFYPLLLWYRRQTVVRAWLLALTGLLMPNVFYISFFKDPKYILCGILTMSCIYSFAWVVEDRWKYKYCIDTPKVCFDIIEY